MDPFPFSFATMLLRDARGPLTVRERELARLRAFLEMRDAEEEPLPAWLAAAGNSAIGTARFRGLATAPARQVRRRLRGALRRGQLEFPDLRDRLRVEADAVDRLPVSSGRFIHASALREVADVLGEQFPA